MPRRTYFLSIGARQVAMLCVLEFIAPLVLYPFNLDYTLSYHFPVADPGAWIGVAFMAVAVGFGLLVASGLPKLVPQRLVRPLMSGTALWCLSIFSLASGFFTYFSENSQWRYGEMLSLNVPTMAVVTLAYPLASIVVWSIILYDYPRLYSRKFSAVTLKLFILAALGLSAGGLMGGLFFVFTAVVFFAPRFFQTLLFRQGAAPSILKSRSLLATLCLVLLLGFVGLNLGVWSKSRSTETALVYLSPDYLIDRHSVHLFCTFEAMEESVNGEPLSVYGDRWRELMQSFLFRLDTVLGGGAGVERPVDGSINRVTVKKWALYQINDREGTSPGFIGTFALYFPPLLSIPLTAIFVIALCRVLDYLLLGVPCLTIPGMMIVAYFPLRLLTDCPLELILPQTEIIVYGLIAIGIYKQKRLRRLLIHRRK